MNVTLRRLESDIKRVVTTALSEIKDRKITKNLVTVTDVKLTSDLSVCRVFFSALSNGGSDENIAKNRTDAVIKQLAEAEGYFKKAISGGVKMRKIPRVEFVADKSGENGERIDRILSGIFSNNAGLTDGAEVKNEN